MRHKMVLRLFNNRNFIFLLAIAMGLAFPQAVPLTEPIMLWALAFVMMLATLNVPNDFFKSPRAILLPSIVGILMTYLILGGFILSLSAILINHDPFRIGFILIAAVPPAIAVIPFSGALGGNVSYALAGTVASYLAALFIMPLIFIALIGTNFADPVKLVRLMVILIVLPLLLSRIVIYMNLRQRLASIKGLLTDWSFFIVMYTIIGMNRDLIFEKPLMIAPSVLIAFAATFLLGYLIEKIGLLFKVDRKDVISLMLLGTLKNLGISGGLALSLFTKESALPAAVYNIFMILYFIWLDLRRS
jgi:bile acid:Na+ symporter, BASS family